MCICSLQSYRTLSYVWRHAWTRLPISLDEKRFLACRAWKALLTWSHQSSTLGAACASRLVSRPCFERLLLYSSVHATSRTQSCRRTSYICHRHTSSRSGLGAFVGNNRFPLIPFVWKCTGIALPSIHIVV